MSWEQRCLLEQRVEFVERALSGDESISELCFEFGISRSCGYKWLNRYQKEGGIVSLRDRSRRPHKSPSKTSEETEKRIRDLYEEYGWGPKKIRKLLSNKGIELPLITVRRIYERNGLRESRNVIGPTLERFEKSSPNEMLQMDFKGQFMTDEGKWCFPLTILDDHSRFCLGLHAIGDQRLETTERCIISTFKKYGVPQGILMDHGVPWWSIRNQWGLTRLSVGLIKQGIELKFSRIRHPQTQGKVERFHRTLKQELHRQGGKLRSIKTCENIFERFRHIYNEIRPHESLGQEPPITRYKPSQKEYSPVATPWEYPEGSTIVRLDGLGRVSYQGKRFFVCEALPEEQVRIIPLEFSALVVFRDMAIREIDLDTGASNPTAFKVSQNFAPWG